jgi:cytochrome c
MKAKGEQMFRAIKGIGFVTMMAGAVALGGTAAQAAGSPTAGKQVFARCAICHSDTKGAPNKIGPNLWGVVGSKPGTVPGFNFSPAMKKANFTWTDEKLEAYVMHPQQVVPGNRMPFGGLSSHKQAEDLVAFLDTLK